MWGHVLCAGLHWDPGVGGGVERAVTGEPRNKGSKQAVINDYHSAGLECSAWAGSPLKFILLMLKFWPLELRDNNFSCLGYTSSPVAFIILFTINKHIFFISNKVFNTGIFLYR